jgi:hypothetical protein
MCAIIPGLELKWISRIWKNRILHLSIRKEQLGRKVELREDLSGLLRRTRSNDI